MVFNNAFNKVFEFFTTNIATIMLIWVFVAFIICIFTRYFFHGTLARIEESYTLAFVFLALFGGAYGFQKKGNVTFDLVYDALKPRGKVILDILSKMVIILAFSKLVIPFWSDILFYNMKKSSMLKLSYMILYMPMMLIVCGAIYYNFVFLVNEDIPKLIRSIKKKNIIETDAKEEEDG